MSVHGEQVGEPERRADQREVDEDFREAPAMHDHPAEPPLLHNPGAFLDVGQEARKLNEEGEGHEHSEKRDPPVVDDGVGETRAAQRRGDDSQQDHRPPLGEARVDEAVGRVVPAALRDRAAFEQPHHGHERRVEDRDGEDQHRQQQRRDRGAGRLPARRDAERR